ncbi:MAG: NAD(P)H-hydrate epimerase, partial [Bacteroidales bacterium]|nr:NAD(P)H-hydrate epimerase [Bacteroidales bacterium]
MKILSSKQMHESDAYTIEHEPITSIDLMERATTRFFEYISKTYPNKTEFCVFCGKGNNGGDGLAIARMLASQGKGVTVYIVNYTDSASDDFLTNYERLLEMQSGHCKIIELAEFQNITISQKTIIIDGIFGSGLNRPITGFTADYISFINTLSNKKIAIDIPSGLFADEPTPAGAIVFCANETITFQSPKLQFLFAENQRFVGKLTIADIQLKNPFSETETPFEFVTRNTINIRPRNQFAHKGTFGHALLVSGSYGKIGAAELASKACLRTGCGLLTTHCPSCGYEIMQIAVPEAMVSVDENENLLSTIPDSSPYSAVG